MTKSFLKILMVLILVVFFQNSFVQSAEGQISEAQSKEGLTTADEVFLTSDETIDIDLNDGDLKRIDLFIYRHLVQAIKQYKNKKSYEVDSVIEALSQDPSGIREYLVLINWQFSDYKIGCVDEIAKDLVKKLKGIPSLRFDFGVDFYCDDLSFSKNDNIKTPIQVKAIE